MIPFTITITPAAECSTCDGEGGTWDLKGGLRCEACNGEGHLRCSTCGDHWSDVRDLGGMTVTIDNDHPIDCCEHGDCIGPAVMTALAGHNGRWVAAHAERARRSKEQREAAEASLAIADAQQVKL